MPRVPGYEDVPEVGLRNTRDIIEQPRSAALEETVRTVDKVGELVGRIADQQNEIALNRADIETALELDQIRERYRTDDDWQTAPDRARDEAEALLKARGEGLRGGATRRAWEMHATERLGRFHLDMRAQSRERGASLARADLVRLGETAEAAAGDLANSEDVRQRAVQSYAAGIDSALQRGMLDPDDAARLETGFANNVRARVQDGLRAEVAQRLDQDPGDLADELADPQSDFRTLDADERARLERQARISAASMAMDDALEETYRTGAIVGEDNPRLAGGWTHLGEGARLQYAERAARAASTHRLASQMGALTGLSLAEIASRADQAQDASDEAAARALLREIRRDPATYMSATQPDLQRAQQRAAAAIEAARNAPQGPEGERARAAATEARLAYVNANLAAQAAAGVPEGDRRVFSVGAVDDWARRVMAQNPDGQDRSLYGDPQTGAGGLYETLMRQLGDVDLASRAYAEHMEALRAAQMGGAHAPPPTPAQRAASGADAENVRAMIERAVRAGQDPAGPVVQSYLSQLPPAERDQIQAALGGAPTH